MRNTRRRLSYGLTAVLLCGLCAVPAAAQTIAITGGRVLPVSGPAIDNGTVLIRDGKIVAVGANVTIPGDAQRVDATGKTVTPGLIDVGTELGLEEIGAISGTDDFRARGRDSVSASLQVWEGFNPNSVLILPTRQGGVTTVMIVPQGGLISGQSAMMELNGGTTRDMLLKGPVAMFGYFGTAQNVNQPSRGLELNKLRAVFNDVRLYATNPASFDRAQVSTLSASPADLQALIPVLQGRLPLVLNVEKASDIQSAIDVANEYKIKLMIVGGAEAWEVAPRLAAAHVPVITGAMNNIPSNFAQLGTRQENAALLRKAGVSVALIGNAGGGDEEAFNVRNIRFEAGNAVAYGMSWDDALRAITLTPAELFGVADRVGSLQAGKDADVVVWSGDPFEFATQPEHVFVRGKEDRSMTRQDMLEQRYKRSPPDYKKP